MRVSQRDVPIEWRRKAVQHLESVRGTPMAPAGSELAEVVGDVCPIYRPDLEEVAYWEFEVVIGAGAGTEVLTTSAALVTPGLADELMQGMADAAEREATARDRGFIMVSTGEHDFPIPHWSLQRPPVSRQLEREAADADATVARIYKLDALAYVAEDETGQEVARSGQTPVPLEGLGHDIGRRAGQISSLTARPEGSR